MTIRRAVSEARRTGSWMRFRQPISVIVVFETIDGKSDETELDLYCVDKESELSDLWDDLCREMDSLPHLVLSIEAFDHINE